MERFTDGKKTVEITMAVWLGPNRWWSPDMTADILEVASFPFDEELGARIVDDVDYIVEYAEDWKNGEGDFYEERLDPDFDPEKRMVDIVYR